MSPPPLLQDEGFALPVIWEGILKVVLTSPPPLSQDKGSIPPQVTVGVFFFNEPHHTCALFAA